MKLTNPTVKVIAATVALTVAWTQYGYAQQQVTLPMNSVDGLEFTWDIGKNGQVVDGGGDLFDNAFVLSVDGGRFPDLESGTLLPRESGKELVIGPRVVGPVTVTRKIYFGTTEGHIRYLDLLENKTTTPVSVDVRLSTNSGSGGWRQVWDHPGVFVGYSGTGSKIAHFFGGEGASANGTLELAGDNYYVTWKGIPIQPESRVALLHFAAQRNDREQVLEFAQKFQVDPACIDLAAEDLASITNYDPRTLGARAGIAIFRGDENDIVLLKSGDKLTGLVGNESVRIQTSYALLEFSTAQIATIIFEGGANNIERIVVLNGDVFSGFIIDPNLSLKLVAGPSIALRKEKIDKLGFRIRESEQQEYPVHHAITLTNGDHFSGRVTNPQLSIETSFGTMPLELGQIAKIEFISKKGTVTQITLKNGDQVSGFLKEEDLSINLDFGREVKIYQDRVEKIIFDREALESIASRSAVKKDAERDE